MAKFKNVLDTQMKEFRQMQDDEERARQQERQDMLNQVKENQRLAAAEKAHHDAVRDKAKSINEQSLESLRRRRKADEDRRQREQDCMLKWLHNENERLRQQRIADAEEYARKCKQAQDEMLEAMEEAARRKKARQDEDKAFAMAGEQAADDAEARNRAAVQARMDQIERNCQTIGADIAGRDARLEAELQAKIQKIQDDADQAAKEDAARRKADRDAKVKDMLDTLNLQMMQRDDEAQREKEDGIKQARLFQEQYEQGLAADRAKEEKARQARLAMDAKLVEKMRSAWRLKLDHSSNAGSCPSVSVRTCCVPEPSLELAYNRGLYEQMAVEGFMMPLTSKFLPQATHTGKLDPHPSCGRYTGEIDVGGASSRLTATLLEGLGQLSGKSSSSSSANIRTTQDSRRRAALKQRLKQFHPSDCEHRSCAGISIRSASCSVCRVWFLILAMLRLMAIDPGVVEDGGDERNDYDAGDAGEEADVHTHHTLLIRVVTMKWT
ncbi:unnamed protein product [Symbiodinium sp. CCMP2456]|nr:unnamed protein product [Symbiodinium sp. CCMP2456]